MSVWINSSGEPLNVHGTTASVTKAEMKVYAEESLVPALRRLLADVFSFYLRAHGYHWNVMGGDFSQYHALFEAIYEDTYESVDELAENIRKMDGVAPFRLPELMALRSINDTPIQSAMPADMTADLLMGNEQVLMSLQMTFEIANAVNEQGVANFIAERIDAHQKWSWQLKSSLSIANS